MCGGGHFFSGNFFSIRIILFFFSFKTFIASWWIFGAITTSQNKSLIVDAVDLLISELEINTPPKAEIGSAAKASLYASSIVFLIASPQALLCFRMAKVGFSSLNSEIKSIAESISKRLLKEISFPCNSFKFLLISPIKTPSW